MVYTARFHLIGDNEWKELQKVLASDGAEGDRFAQSVSVSGDVAVMGAFMHGDNGSLSGAAYLFTREPDGSWTQMSKLLASDGAAGGAFGHSVAVSGDVAVIGAIGDDDNGIRSGSAYVFARQADGSWIEQAKLIAGDGAAGDAFGISVAVSGDVVFIGADRDDDSGTDSGSAYEFVLRPKPVNIGGTLPVATALLGNRPNPFNPTTTISYALAQDGEVSILIFNSLGQTVRRLFVGHQVAGNFEIVWDARDDSGRLVSSGLYFTQFTADGKIQTKRMSLIR